MPAPRAGPGFPAHALIKDRIFWPGPAKEETPGALSWDETFGPAAMFLKTGPESILWEEASPC
jgi:hypothetical protein